MTEFPDSTPRPWYFDGWDIFTSSSSAGPRGDGHRMVVPLKAINDTFHPSQRVSDDDARLIVAAVNERERDRRRIAQLTECLEEACDWNDPDLSGYAPASPAVRDADRELVARWRAVLAGEGDT